MNYLIDSVSCRWQRYWTMTRRVLYLVVLVLLGSLSIKPPAVFAQPRSTLDTYASVLDSLMRTADVPGISFAFFSSEGVLFEYAQGVKGKGSREPVGAETVFEAASISKPVFAVLVQSLVEEGVIDVTRPLAHYVDPVPEVSYDTRSSALTPEMLLSHQGGLPNWRARINLEARTLDELFSVEDTLRFISDPGTAYGYSGEGFLLLQRVIEDLTSESLETLTAARIFDPLAMTRTSFSFNATAEKDYALGHSQDGQPNKFGLRASLSSSSLHTTAGDLARFGTYLANNIGIEGPLALLIEPVVSVDEKDDVRFSWGLGFGVVDTPTGRYIYHGGNNVIFIADFIYSLEEDLGYVLLTNSANGIEMVRPLEERVFGRWLWR
ncbi:MAG: beta-lactamase family protein [Rhodothermaceae bacterium]|nr:beta-lactamase family protein [Rhodothermaceae bacterium]